MSFTLTTSGAIIRKAGDGANSTIVASEAALQNWCDQAEAQLNTICRFDWVTNFATIGAEFKNILDDVASDIAAMKVISYDMSGYRSRLEAQILLDVTRDNISRNIEVLKDEKYKEKMS